MWCLTLLRQTWSTAREVEAPDSGSGPRALRSGPRAADGGRRTARVLACPLSLGTPATHYSIPHAPPHAARGPPSAPHVPLPRPQVPPEDLRVGRRAEAR